MQATNKTMKNVTYGGKNDIFLTRLWFAALSRVLEAGENI